MCGGTSSFHSKGEAEVSSRIPYVLAATALAMLAVPSQAQMRLVEAPRAPILQEGLQSAPPQISVAEVRSNLATEGYSRVELRELVGATYGVRAAKNGRPYLLEVDALTG